MEGLNPRTQTCIVTARNGEFMVQPDHVVGGKSHARHIQDVLQLIHPFLLLPFVIELPTETRIDFREEVAVLIGPGMDA